MPPDYTLKLVRQRQLESSPPLDDHTSKNGHHEDSHTGGNNPNLMIGLGVFFDLIIVGIVIALLCYYGSNEDASGGGGGGSKSKGGKSSKKSKKVKSSKKSSKK